MPKLSKNNQLRILYAGIIVLGILLDQLSKLLAVNFLTEVTTVPLLKNVLHLTYVENRGAAWGMLANHRWVFMLFSTVAILALGVYLFRGVSYLSDKREDGTYPPIAPLGGIALAMIVSGGIGNMIDRIMLGYVVDMFDLLLFDYPIFNLADCFVVVGTILGSIYYLWLYEKYDAPKKESADGTEDPAGDN